MLLKRITRTFTDIHTGVTYKASIQDGNQLFSLPEPAVREGMVISDSCDDQVYFVLETHAEINHGRTVYRRSRILSINASATILRFHGSVAGSFGRPAEADPKRVVASLPGYIHFESMGTESTPDRTAQTTRVSMLLPICEVQAGDRLTTDTGKDYMVLGIDRFMFDGFYVLALTHDAR